MRSKSPQRADTTFCSSARRGLERRCWRVVCRRSPSLSEEEALEVIAIHSVAGVLGGSSVSEGTRPFRRRITRSRAPDSRGRVHPAAGRSEPRASWRALSGRMLEFPRHVLDGLRQPWRTRGRDSARIAAVRILRDSRSSAHPTLPCGRGAIPAARAAAARRHRAVQRAYLGRWPTGSTCTYRRRSCGPIPERRGQWKCSASIRRRVERARATQRARFARKQESRARPRGRSLARCAHPVHAKRECSFRPRPSASACQRAGITAC